MIKSKHYPILLVAAILVVLWFSSSTGSGGYLIGVIGPLTGSASQYGISQRNGVQLAVDLINKAGGIRGTPLRVIFYDDENDKIKAAESARDAIYRDKAVALIGAINSDNTLNIQRVCEQAQVPVITAVSTNPFITRTGYRYTFRCLSDDNIQAEELAQYAYRRMNLRSLAVIHDNNRYGAEGARTYQRFSSRLGQSVTTMEGYQTGELNFRPQLERIRRTNPQGLLVWGLYQESAFIVRQAREMGMNMPIFGGDGMAISSFIDLAGIHADGVVLTYPFYPPRGGDAAKQFIKEYAAVYGTEPDSFAAHAYDAVLLVRDAIDRSDGSGPGVRNALAQIREYNGVTGKGGLDEFGNETRPVLLAQIQGGTFVPLIAGGNR